MANPEPDTAPDDSCTQPTEIPEGAPKLAYWGRLKGLHGWATHQLVSEDVFIGRLKSNTVVIDHPQVSGYHCHIYRRQDPQAEGKYIFYLQNASRNGTYVNAQRLMDQKTTILTHADSIVLLPKVPIEFIFEDSSLTKPSTPEHEVFSQKYRLGDVIGKGNFATVRHARDINTGQSYAVKIIDKKKYSSNAKTAEQLNREVEIIQSVKHGNIITVFDVIHTPRFLYLVLELATGGELFERICDSVYTEDDARSVFAQILSAMEYLHSIGIAHRDLKPENILLSDRSPAAVVKISDFGLARIVGDASQMRTLCGTPQYVAPEILASVNKEGGYGVEIDMWSLGCILFVMLSGYQPFSKELRPGVDLTEQISKCMVEFVAEWGWAKISDEAKDLIMRLLVLDPSQRLSARSALAHPWLRQHVSMTPIKPISTHPCTPLDVAQQSLKKMMSNARRPFSQIDDDDPEPVVKRVIAQVAPISPPPFPASFHECTASSNGTAPVTPTPMI